MTNKTITLYSFDELSKEVQAKVLQNFRDNDECEYLPDDMQYKIEELLEENSITGDARVFYSLSYCQGDGAMFEGNFEWKGYNVNIKHAGRYYHYNSKDITITDDEGNDIDGQIYEKFNDLYVSICEELARYGYDCIKSHNSDENLIDMIEVNNYLFTDKGVIDSI